MYCFIIINKNIILFIKTCKRIIFKNYFKLFIITTNNFKTKNNKILYKYRALQFQKIELLYFLSIIFILEL